MYVSVCTYLFSSEYSLIFREQLYLMVIYPLPQGHWACLGWGWEAEFDFYFVDNLMDDIDVYFRHFKLFLLMQMFTVVQNYG